ncbi:peroxisomal targeting signal 2 receptor [Elysia marginata]|uniref:Peroxin-7 n=1 Tax=Elysia marginata TaxID=1093978 RepID=A0AAV4G8F7_9GAST|nr:peroxisomal targeting signal 2 receptor [Elysia marginata]
MNQTFKTHSRHGYSVKFSPYFSQRLVCATSQYFGIAGCGSLFVLDVSPEGIRPVQIFDWNESLFDVVWAENNENILVASSGDGSIQVWDVAQPKWDISKDQSLQTFAGHDHIVYNASWSPHIHGLFASVSGDRTLRLWDMRRPDNCARLVHASEGEILSCDWCKYDQNIVFTGGVDCIIKGWDVRSLKFPTCELRGHKYAVRRIKASPFHGAIVASSSYDFTVKIWDAAKQECLDTIEHHTEFVYGLDFNLHVPDQMADCGWDQLLHVYNTPPYSKPQNL